MEKENKKQRSIDQAVLTASKSLSSRFVLASKMEIKRWKAFVILMFVAGFSAALIWSAYNGWYLGLKAKNNYKLKNLIYAPYGTKADHEYGDLTDSLMKNVEGSPYDSFAIELSGVHGDDTPSFDSFSSNLSAVKKSGKLVWPRIYFNRVVGCCEAPACVQQLKDSGKCGDTVEREACYKEKSPSTGYNCSDNGYYCKNVCSESHSLSAYFKNIAEKGKSIDLWNKAGALADFYKLLETSLKLAKESGAPGVFIDHEIYHNYRMYRVSTVARDNGITADEVKARLEAVGAEIADRTNAVYPDAVIMFASALSVKQQSDGLMRSTNYITEGILKRAKEKNYKLKVVDGGEKTLWYLHSALNDPGTKDKDGGLAGLKQRLDGQENEMNSYLEKYSKNFTLGGTHGLYLDWKDTRGNWNAWLTDIFNKKKLEVKSAVDLSPLMKHLFEKREYVWVFSGAPSSKGYDEFSYGKDPDYISKFRNILQPLFCGNDVCEKNRAETCVNCPGDCGVCSTPVPVPAPGPEPKSCGNGKCQEEKGETCSNCPGDCSSICPISTPFPESDSCGDGKCKKNESCSNCERDCGACEKDDPLAPSVVLDSQTRQIPSGEPLYTASKRIDFKGVFPEIARGKVRIFQDGKLKKIVDVKKSGDWRKKIDIKKSRTFVFQLKYYDRDGKEVYVSEKYEVVKRK